jgi:two-component system sensor histidine kinase VicK
MKFQIDADSSAGLLRLLNEARMEADDLRRRLERNERTLLSTRLIMGHELKRPTTAIRGYLDLALEATEPTDGDNDGDGAIDAIRKAQGECNLIDELSTFFLQLLKMDGRRAAGREEIVEVKGCLSEILGRFPDSLNARSRVTTRVEPQAAKFRTDIDALKIVLENVIENALLYTDHELPVEVHVERARDKRRSGSEDLLKIKVADRGKGIPEDFVKRIFSPFVRLNEQAAQGVGLGLTLVRSLVELHGGSVSIWSQEGRGTTVYVTLPEMPATNGGAILS